MRAQNGGEEVMVSLVTCSPGQEAYSLYGHTAIRVTLLQNGRTVSDVAYNYGAFDASQPNFQWEFMMGHTDYWAEGVDFRDFIWVYVHEGRDVREQILNLTPAEARLLTQRLRENARPENSQYRYNFLVDNCTTRARDMIERAVTGSVFYHSADKNRTYRELLHEKMKNHPWTEAGIDLLLGSVCDTVLSERATLFLPELLERGFSDAEILDSIGNRRPLVKVAQVVYHAPAQQTKEGGMGPVACIWILVGAFVLIAAAEYRFRRVMWGVDAVLMLAHGLTGLLVTFMFLFSQHPAVGSNWQIWVLNPIPLFALPWVLKCAIKHIRCYYHIANAVVLALFVILSPWVPQNYSVIMIPLALILLTRPVSYLLSYRRKKRR